VGGGGGGGGGGGVAVTQPWLAVHDAFPTLSCVLFKLKRGWNNSSNLYYVNLEQLPMNDTFARNVDVLLVFFKELNLSQSAAVGCY
jgi:hypothetical protein